ncbi:hypothetical protein HPB50_000268 [Hyalomma asiaticum]|uniref:Uncharacterized protein n=1 Tax=Hyalomma asiaticum TaxID=266040 RepID=A0ACB7S681_HYAAI|nr:hypothetical protein HPB50_000268 [Hyalomma asiaticum]
MDQVKYGGLFSRWHLFTGDRKSRVNLSIPPPAQLRQDYSATAVACNPRCVRLLGLSAVDDAWDSSRFPTCRARSRSWNVVPQVLEPAYESCTVDQDGRFLSCYCEGSSMRAAFDVNNVGHQLHVLIAGLSAGDGGRFSYVPCERL